MADELDNNQSRPPSLPGSQLRAQRERRGLTLTQVASELHVDLRVLRALEEDDYAALGAPIFVKGHLRNYARLLGLDPAEVIAQYEAAQQPADPALVAQRFDGPRMEHHRSSAWLGWLGWLFLLVIGVALAGWWYYQREGGAGMMSEPPLELPRDDTRTPADTSPVMEPETRDTAPDESQVPPADTQEQPAEEFASPETPPAGDDAPVTRPESSSPRTQGGGTGEQVQAPAQTSRPANTTARPLVFEFSQESWVEVYDAEGRPILYDLVAPGSRREINATGRLRVFLGNADGVEIFVRGERFAHQRFRRADSTARFTLDVPQ